MFRSPWWLDSQGPLTITHSGVYFSVKGFTNREADKEGSGGSEGFLMVLVHVQPPSCKGSGCWSKATSPLKASFYVGPIHT